MKPEKISHLKEDGTLRNERKKRVEYTLAENGGKIVSYQPYKSLQLIFYDLHTSDLPDLWKLGFRKGSRERYVRALICQRGSCEFTINGKTDTISEGQIVTDYGVGDNLSFGFTTDDFAGVEIAVQESLTNQSSMFRMLRLVLESMYLPEEEVFDSDGYIFSISTCQTTSRTAFCPRRQTSRTSRLLSRAIFTAVFPRTSVQSTLRLSLPKSTV